MPSRRPGRPNKKGLRQPRRPSHYVSLAGEFFVLGELALRRLDGTLTLGHTKGIDILVLNPHTKQTFKVEVKTTEGKIRNSRLFGEHYSWLMNERHAHIDDQHLVYAFVLLHRGPDGSVRPRVFLMPSKVVAAYIKWNQKRTEDNPTGRRRGRPSTMRQFRIPAADPRRGNVPRAWQAQRWRQWENNWEIFEPRSSIRGTPE